MSLLIEQEQESSAHLLNWNECQKNQELLVPSKATAEDDTSDSPNINKISQQNVQWIHRKLQLWCLPTQGKKEELIDWLAKLIIEKMNWFETLEEAKKTKKKNKHKK